MSIIFQTISLLVLHRHCFFFCFFFQIYFASSVLHCKFHVYELCLLLFRYNLLFFVSGGGKFNYQGTKRWLEDNLDHTGAAQYSWHATQRGLNAGEYWMLKLHKDELRGTGWLSKKEPLSSKRFMLTYDSGIHFAARLVPSILVPSGLPSDSNYTKTFWSTV